MSVLSLLHRHSPHNTATQMWLIKLTSILPTPYTLILSDSLLFDSVWWMAPTVTGVECGGLIEDVDPIRQYCVINI